MNRWKHYFENKPCMIANIYICKGMLENKIYDRNRKTDLFVIVIGGYDEQVLCYLGTPKEYCVLYKRPQDGATEMCLQNQWQFRNLSNSLLIFNKAIF